MDKEGDGYYYNFENKFYKAHYDHCINFADRITMF